MKKEHWTYKTFNDLMKPSKVERCGDRQDLPVLSITMHNGIIEQSDRFSKTIASKDKSDYKVVKNGQLVIAFPIDEGLLYTQDVADEGIMSPAYNIWDIDFSQIDRRFLVSYFHSPFAFSYYKAKLRGSTQRRRSMDKTDLLSMPIPVPSLEIQHRIMSELDCLMSVVDKKKSQLSELDNLAQSIFFEMFGDPVINNLGWKTVLLNAVSSFKNGINYHANESGQKIKCIGVGDFKDNREIHNFDNIVTLHLQETVDSEYLLHDGDIIIVRSNGSKSLVGRNMIVYTSGERVTYSGFCIRCRITSDEILPIFLNRILSDRSIMAILRQEGQGCNISNINQKILSSLNIILPPLSFQQTFVEKIEAIEAMKAKIRQSLEESENLFNSRMDYYFN